MERLIPDAGARRHDPRIEAVAQRIGFMWDHQPEDVRDHWRAMAMDFLAVADTHAAQPGAGPQSCRAAMAPHSIAGAVILSVWMWLTLVGFIHSLMWLTGASRGALL